jgi:mono/diheme cytochrome c family protein
MQMIRATSILLFLLTSLPLSVPAQQTGTDRSLNDTQKLGRRIFQQRCGVCHTKPTRTSPMYGPVLYKDIVEGNEDAIRQFIRSGSARMPGFKYGLEPMEINAIVEYLKTVPKPPKSGSPSDSTPGPMD